MSNNDKAWEAAWKQWKESTVETGAEEGIALILEAAAPFIEAKALREAERLVAPDDWEYDEQFHYFYEGRKWAAQYLRIRADQLDPEGH